MACILGQYRVCNNKMTSQVNTLLYIDKSHVVRDKQLRYTRVHPHHFTEDEVTGHCTKIPDTGKLEQRITNLFPYLTNNERQANTL